MAIIELRLAKEAAPLTYDLENPSRLDPFAGDWSAAPRLVAGVLSVSGGAAPARNLIAADPTPSLAVTAAPATAAPPSPATAPGTSSPILAIARFSGAMLAGMPVVIGPLAIGWLGRGGGARGSMVRAATPPLRSSRSGTGGPAVIPSMIVSQG